MQTQVNIQEILKILPHRYPFILIDRVIDLVPGRRVRALKNVTMNEPFFQGHFPGDPIMPGVLILEAMAQAGAVLAYPTVPVDAKDRFMYFLGLDRVRFRKPVVPGDQLILDLEILHQRSHTFKLAGTALVDQNRIAQAEFLAMIGEKNDPSDSHH